jgi:hypothetical protein
MLISATAAFAGDNTKNVKKQEEKKECKTANCTDKSKCQKTTCPSKPGCVCK